MSRAYCLVCREWRDVTEFGAVEVLGADSAACWPCRRMGVWSRCGENGAAWMRRYGHARAKPRAARERPNAKRLAAELRRLRAVNGRGGG